MTAQPPTLPLSDARLDVILAAVRCRDDEEFVPHEVLSCDELRALIHAARRASMLDEALTLLGEFMRPHRVTDLWKRTNDLLRRAGR